jgi:hypothetical protein
MTQFARPIATTSAGNASVIGDTPLHNTLDEVTPDEDTTLVQFPNSTTNGHFRVQLTSIEAPAAGVQTIRTRVRYSGGASSKTYLIRLYEDDGTTLVQEWTGLTPTGQTYDNVDLTVTETISDYTNLHIYMATGSEDSVRIKITQLFLSVPDAVSGPAAGGDPVLAEPPEENQVKLSFTASADATGCYLHRDTASGFTPSVSTRISADLGAGVTSVLAFATADLQQYYLVEWVLAGESTYSGQLAAKTAPNKPTDLAFSNITGTSMTVTLTPGTDAGDNDHRVFVYAGELGFPGDYVTTLLYPAGTTVLTINGLDIGTSYVFKAQSYVIGINDGVHAYSTFYQEAYSTINTDITLAGAVAIDLTIAAGMVFQAATGPSDLVGAVPISLTIAASMRYTTAEDGISRTRLAIPAFPRPAETYTPQEEAAFRRIVETAFVEVQRALQELFDRTL